MTMTTMFPYKQIQGWSIHWNDVLSVFLTTNIILLFRQLRKKKIKKKRMKHKICFNTDAHFSPPSLEAWMLRGRKKWKQIILRIMAINILRWKPCWGDVEGELNPIMLFYKCGWEDAEKLVYQSNVGNFARATFQIIKVEMSINPFECKVYFAGCAIQRKIGLLVLSFNWNSHENQNAQKFKEILLKESPKEIHCETFLFTRKNMFEQLKWFLPLWFFCNFFWKPVIKIPSNYNISIRNHNNYTP